MTKTDLQLKRDIEDELRWDPRVNAAQIGVSVDMGAVTLHGAVDTYAAKEAAANAVKRVAGVSAVAQDLTVKLLAAHQRSDSDIAGAVQGALRWDVLIPESVTARVQDGVVTLEGRVAWHYEREAADRAVRYLTGVVGVWNTITLTQDACTSDLRQKVAAALQRQATRDASSIQIEVCGGRVTLSGSASSWQSIDDAAAAAWAAPGVREVVDNIRLYPRI